MFVVCGEALYDVFAQGHPAADGSVGLRGIAGGSPFNVAIGMARMGVTTGLLASLSQDMFGEALLMRLRAEGVSDACIIRKERPTTLSVVGLDRDGSPNYAFYGDRGADLCLMEADLPTFGTDVVGFHFGSYSMVAGETARTLFGLVSREQHRFISYDANVRLNVEPALEIWRSRIREMLKVATVMKLSEEDVALLWPGSNAEALALDWAGQGPSLVALTLGSRGAVAFAGNRRIDVEAPAIDVIDTVGAGDAFMAQLLSALCEQDLLSRPAIGAMPADRLQDLLRRSVVAASMTCARRGADPPSRTEIAKAMAENS